jgi:hypothetical protein
VNRDEAKNILLIYRHGTADADDPQIAEALALAKRDPELARWLETHCARQLVLREKFRQIAVPAGLKEQIISEQASAAKIVPFWHQKISLVPTMAVMAVILLSSVLASVWFANHREPDDTLAVYQNQMVRVALRGYGMDLLSNDPVPIRAYLDQNHAPSDFVLPGKLNQANLVGCAVEGWQNTKVSMICFHTAKFVAGGGQSDLWLFVVDRASVKGAPADVAPQFSKVNRLITATWTQDNKLYLLGTEGDEQTIKQYL